MAFLNSIIADFCKIHPMVHFEIIYTGQVLNIFEESIDIALRVERPTPKSLIFKSLGTIQFMLVARA